MATNRGRSATDKFTNILTQALTLSAANTLTFAEIDVGLNLFDRVGLLINRAEFHIRSTVMAEFTAGGDNVQLGLTASNGLSQISETERAVIYKTTMARSDFGTAGSAQFTVQPLVVDFADLPGGGMLVAPKPLYFAGDSIGLASAHTFYLRLFFTIMTLKDADYFELLESRRFFG